MKRAALLVTLAVLAIGTASAQVKITTTDLPDGYTNNLFYSQTIAATISGPLASTSTLTWTVAAGALPPGLVLDGPTGRISGFPTNNGSYTFTIGVQINFTGFTDHQDFTITVRTPRVTIVTDANLPSGVVLENYQVQLLANTSPALPLLWTISQLNPLPGGLTMTPQGLISGAPQLTGTYTFAITVLMGNTGINDTRIFTLVVYAGRVHILSQSPLPAATVNQNFSYTFQVQPASGITWINSQPPFGLTFDPVTAKLSGVPTQSGTYTFILNAAAAGFIQDTETFTIFVTAGPLSIFDTSLPIAIQGTQYSYKFTPQAGLGPYLWRVTGTLPAGLALDLNKGILSGIPTVPGPYTFTIEVTDATGSKFARLYTFFVAGPLTVLTTSLPNASVGVNYNQTISAGGGQAPYTWRIVSGDIPPGIQISSQGVLTGVPARNGFFQFTVQVTDNGLRTATLTLSLNVGGISISNSSLPDAGLNVDYVQTLQAAGGIGPYAFTLTAGPLPPGLSLDPGGAIHGSATQIGTYSFAIQVADAAQSIGTRQFTMNVVAALQISTGSVSAAGLGALYSQKITAVGGTPPYSWSIELGALPSGLSLDAPSGVISGTPTSPGSFSFGVLVADKGVQFARKTYTIVIPGAFAIITSDLSAISGAPFSQALVATGGTAPYTWNIASGSLPTGLTLNGSTGAITGNPTATGAFTFIANVVDSKNLSTQKTITITVMTAPVLPSFTISVPNTSAAAQQPQVSLTLGSAYPADISGSLTLSFQSAVGGDDQTVRFSTGNRSINFQIPAGNTIASFPDLPSRSPVPSLLTGTVGGTITFTAKFASGGSDITPANATTNVIVGQDVPVITSVALQASGGTLNVIVTGYSTTREISSGTFHLTPASGVNLGQSDFNVPLSSTFTAWYTNTASNATGGEFTLTQPFSLQVGAGSVTSVSVTLTNSKGSSTAVSSQ